MRYRGLMVIVQLMLRNDGPKIPQIHSGDSYQLGVVMELKGVPQYAAQVSRMI